MDRLVSASLAELLENVGPSIASGAVNLISVAAIRERSDERWPRKREQVVSFVERAFSKLCRAGDLIVPLNDTEFLTIQPNSSRSAALSLSANLLKETLAFFVGAVEHQDLRLFQVTSFVGGELALQAVASARLTDAADDDAPMSSPGRMVAPPAEALGRLARPHHVTLTVPSRGPLDLTIEAQPIWNASARAVVSYALRTKLHLPASGNDWGRAGAPEPSPALAAEVALAVVKRAAEILDGLSVRTALHLPLQFRALGFSTARYRVLHALRELPADLRKLLILEIVELSPGLPPGRLAEVVSTLTPYARAVLARAEAETAQVAVWRGCGLHGVSVDCSQIEVGDRLALFKLTRFVQGARAVGRSCVAYDLASRSLLMTAWAAGCTHLCGPSVSMDVLPHPGPVRLRPLDLFAADLRDTARTDTDAIQFERRCST